MRNGQLQTVVGYLRRVAGADHGDKELLRRFAQTRDEQAFAVLMRRHGRMVWGVCRHVLGHDQDGEDAFQATFLTLACRAGCIRKAEAVASWLHGTAYRIALRAKRDAAIRRARERRGGSMSHDRIPAGDLTGALAMLDEEVARLSDKHRAVFVLCHLEGKSRQEAARQLGWKEGTVAGTLARACQRLRQRLARRGVTLSAMLSVLALEGASSASVPAALARLTYQTAKACVANPLGVKAVASAAVVFLVQRACRTMMLSKLQCVSVILMAIFAACGTMAALVAAGAEAPTKAVAKGNVPVRSQAATSQRPQSIDAKKPKDDEKNDTVEVTGRVVDPDGKPFAGAKVFFARSIVRPLSTAPAQSTTDADGRFRLLVSRIGYQDDYEKDQWLQGAVIALGKGFGFGWAGDDNAEKLTNVTVRLVKDVPIEGRVLDLEGKPIAEVRVNLQNVRFREKGDGLQDAVKVLKSERRSLFDRQYWNSPSWPRMRIEPAILGLTPTATTGADGKFRLTGVSGECLVALRFEGPTIETAEVYAMTRHGPTIHVPADKNIRSRAATFHGATFDHVAAPARPIVGVVRDKDTGKPLAGVTIQNETYGPGHGIQLSAKTDGDGRYRLAGLSREPGQSLLAVPPEGQPYLRAALTSTAATGLEPVTLDFTLKRGVFIRGRVTDKLTGRPLPALVEYFAFDDNPFLRQAPGYRDSHSIEVRTEKDGTFTVLALPGRGLVAAKAAGREQEGSYLMAVNADKIRGLEPESCNTHPNCCNATSYNTLVEVNPVKDTKSTTCDVVFDPGKTVTGIIVGPDGQPVKNASIDSVHGVWFHVKDLPTAEFRIPGVDPKHPRAFFFRDRGAKLGAAVLFNGDEMMPVKIRLQKCATITGRLVDEDGLPCAAILMGHIHKGQLNITSGVGAFNESAGEDGRFRIEGVIPGLKVGIWAGKNFTYFDQHLVEELTLQAGEVKDLGDLKRKIME